MSIAIAACPHCGGPCVAELDRYHGGIPRWQVHCDKAMGPTAGGNYLPDCGYRGPFAIVQDEAVRWHNKIAQNCGACQ